ncbi:MAG: 23S rRNA (uracil(1939)-C(5))-methyltransferase RlmD [Oscillospiraceae bacterium]|nr:23S rRNA (uracil(1939)-C(5))-methyltransferase RlmD [Oscillospiraceae bacterium]
MKKNDIYTTEITGMTAEGNGVGRIDGIAVFVPHTAVGDVISCRIVKTAKSYAYGIIDSIEEPSPDRIESGCPVSKKCGGCSFRHIRYSAELEIKDKLVRDAFLRIGGFDSIPFEDICGGESDFYRNKAQYPVAEQEGMAVCGFYSRRSHRVIPFTSCKLQPGIFGEIAEFCLEFINDKKIPAYNEENCRGVIRHIYIRRGFHSGEIMLCLVVKDESKSDELSGLAEAARKNFPDIVSVIMNVNPKNTNVILGEKNITLSGSGEITDILCGKKITLSPMSFYQVNTAMAERLYGCAMEYADLTGNETVLDLYCGAGTIGLSFSDRAGKIIGCEIVPEAVENAKRNAEINGVSNAEFYCGDAGQLAKKLADEGIAPDVAVIDPPRKGCDTLTLDSLVRMSPKKIVMISCDPATAARDAKYLSGQGYKPTRARAFDLFPRTGHVETVVLLSKGEIESKKVRVEFSLEDMDMSGFQKGATYGEIKAYVLEKYHFKVSSLYISQVKRKCGLDVGQNYNLPKSENAKQPQCPPDKEKAIMEALRHFRMIK